MEFSGFFNAKLVDGQYDRTYNADDYQGNLGAIISNGVRKGVELDDDGNIIDAGELKVITYGGSMDIVITSGRAWINGAWYYNDAPLSLTLETPHNLYKRIDRVVLRYDNNLSGRNISAHILTGTPSSTPKGAELTRTKTEWEICLAEIEVPSQQEASVITQDDITDQRGNGKYNFTQVEEGGKLVWKQVKGDDLCGWITTPVGYDGFFKAMDSQIYEYLNTIDEEWTTMKDRWASVTMFKKYEDTHITTATITSIEVPITQYDPTGVDILEIFVNGIYVREGIDYTRNGKIINFTMPKIVGTEISFSVYKSIDGTGLGSVSEEITDIQNQIAEINNIAEYRYMCTGENDNIKLSQMCSDFFDGTDDGKEFKINIYGNFVASVPNSGSGTPVSRYKWIDVSPTGSTSRKITLDFSNCSKIILPAGAGSSYVIFNGKDMTIIGASIESKIAGASNDSGTAIEVFSSTNGTIKAIRCRFDLAGYERTFIGETGTFDDCIATCSVESGEGYCFYTNSNGLLRIMGGEYKAYTKATSSNAMVVKQVDSGAVVIMLTVNCPTVAKSGYRQTHAINASGGTAIAQYTITQLTVTAGTVGVTINANKPDRG